MSTLSMAPTPIRAHTTSPRSDASLADATAAALSLPRDKAADSFVLHAPLELLARVGLLSLVEPGGRDAARARIEELGEQFTAWGAAAQPPRRAATHDNAQDAVRALGDAISAGELEDVDATASWLASRLDARELAGALADPVLPLLSAAAHGSIFLYHLPRVAPRSRTASLMLRGLVREMARYPGWDLSWFRALPSHPSRDEALGGTLARRLARPASPGDPGSDFVYPVMSLTEQSGLAHDVLADIICGLPVEEARRVLLRVAAHSMLQDDPSHAPYGWSHCLTMPQATLGIAHACSRPSHAVAVAATYVLGFRSVLGRTALALDWAPDEPSGSDPIGALDGTPAEAAAAGWHADPATRAAVVARLATRAAAHHDAHLAKYTLACFDAAHADPDATPLYLAAAAYLGAWWADVDTSN
jgi:hypothetical protein